MVLKTFDRVDGEIVEFRVDPKQGRIIEVGSNINKKYVSTLPTRRGVENEKLHSSVKDGVLWRNEILFTSIDATTYTSTISEEDVHGHPDVTRNRSVINTGLTNLSIFQEKTNGSPYQDFSFSLKKSDNSVLTFNPSRGATVGTIVPYGVQYPNEEYMKNYWVFIDTTNTYQCFINNTSGKIIFDKENVGLTLAASNNLTIITGDKITSEKWYREYDGSGIEKVTTAERTAVLPECADGYEVIDTDLNTHYRVINEAWV
jgi:hypothetical protein